MAANRFKVFEGPQLSPESALDAVSRARGVLTQGATDCV